MHPHLLESLAKQRHKEFIFEAEHRYLSLEAQQRNLEAIKNQASRPSYKLRLLLKTADFLIHFGISIRAYCALKIKGKLGQDCDTPC